MTKEAAVKTLGPEYLELSLKASGEEAEIWMARLAEAGFDSFTEESDRLLAYIPVADSTLPEAQEIIAEARESHNAQGATRLIEPQNWNQAWEDNFPPVEAAGGRIYIRALHHVPKPEAVVEILIQPKMSFGTGHHATTALMAELLLEVASGKVNTAVAPVTQGRPGAANPGLRNLTPTGYRASGADEFSSSQIHVIDAGTGTGVLAILAEKLGAGSVEAFDHEPWSAENAVENVEANGCTRIRVACADVALYEPEASAQLVLANITRNLVIESMPRLAQWLDEGGILLCSGFYEEDLAAVDEAATHYRLHFQHHLVKDKWCAARFIKK